MMRKFITLWGITTSLTHISRGHKTNDCAIVSSASQRNEISPRFIANPNDEYFFLFLITRSESTHYFAIPGSLSTDVHLNRAIIGTILFASDLHVCRMHFLAGQKVRNSETTGGASSAKETAASRITCIVIAKVARNV